MTANNQSHNRLILIKAQYQARYGVEMDDWSAVLMADAAERFERMNGQLAANLKENKQVSETFKGAVKQIHFGSKQEAFLYGLARSLPYSVAALVLGILCYWYLSTWQDYKNLKVYIETYRNASAYVELISKGQLIQEDGVIYLTLSPRKKGKHSFGLTYEYDKRQKVARVPLKRID